jgi:hypothetical protein
LVSYENQGKLNQNALRTREHDDNNGGAGDRVETDDSCEKPSMMMETIGDKRLIDNIVRRVFNLMRLS